MTSIYATDAHETSMTTPYYLKGTKEGAPLEGQVPRTSIVVTTSGGIPASCPNHVILSSASAITLTSTNLRNLIGREVTFTQDGTNATAHVITLPANSINGNNRTVTFATNLAAYVRLSFTRVGSTNLASVVGSSNVTLS